MRIRSVAIALAFYLSYALLGCGGKPPANDASNPAGTSGDANTGDANFSGASSGSAMAASKMVEESNESAPAPLVVPAGTVLTVRLGETLSSKTSQAGETFTATVVTPIEAGGRTVIREGATATGTVVAARAAGKFKGASLLQIRLKSVTIGGRSHAIETSSMTRSEKGKGERSAALIGGGAGAGALIGALAGGGKGAAIGALVGGGAGTAGSALTGNADVTLPAESAVSFKLESALKVR